MCGISGILEFTAMISKDKKVEISKNMSDSLIHRGPDGGGVWVDEKNYCALSHRRLSILDLSKNGNQPMISKSKKFVICYNGEVYNLEFLKKKLKSVNLKLRGHSDTELILECCEHFGIKETVNSLIGMFAFAIYDVKKECLFLVRDRVGIKPLFWSITNNNFLFASEIKAFSFFPSLKRTINKNSVADYLKFGYVPSPATIYDDIFKLSPGTILKIDKKFKPKLIKYWSLEKIISKNEKYISDTKVAENELEDLLTDSIKKRMFADVPVGAFLSGGIDSSTVVALMSNVSHKNVKTFSIGFEEQNYNEAIYAKKIANHLKTDHTELYISPKEAIEFIKLIPKHFDEPFSDSSNIPTYLISKMTRRYVKVALSGDGGDELFCGYNRYLLANQFKGLFEMPYLMKLSLISPINLLSEDKWNYFFNRLNIKSLPNELGSKLYKLKKLIGKDKDGFYQDLVSIWNNPYEIVNWESDRKNSFSIEKLKTITPNFIDRMQLIDFLTYLPDDILTKVDRATMAVSLEARVPLLDHRVVEFSWKLKQNLKIKKNSTKWILRQILYKYVPKNLIERPKMGFGVPLSKWLRNELRDWAEYLLSEKVFEKHSLLKRDPIIIKWKQHLSGKYNWQYQIWNILMLHAWAEEYNK